MGHIFSKIQSMQSITAKCNEIHYWDDRCTPYQVEALIVAYFASLRMYSIVYLVSNRLISKIVIKLFCKVYR